MTKHEAPANMEHKVRDLARKITAHCSKFYDKATPEQKEEMFKMLEDLENAMVAYRQYSLPWDSVLIDVVEKIGDRQVKAKAFSTFESVMDKARDVFAFIATGS